MDGQSRGAARVGRGVARGVATLLSVAVLVASGYGWSVADRFGDGLATSDAVAAPSGPRAPEAPFTALLVGLDSRTDTSGRPLPPDVLTQLHAGDDDGQLNTDTIILLHVPRGPEPRAVAVSLPRDSFVEIAGDRGTHKINTAYRRGLAEVEKATANRALMPAERDRLAREAGRRVLVATVENLTGIAVDHFAEV
ncbi:MAG: LCP family protein, partial [Pseudonocardia sp.]